MSKIFGINAILFNYLSYSTIAVPNNVDTSHQTLGKIASYIIDSLDSRS